MRRSEGHEDRDAEDRFFPDREGDSQFETFVTGFPRSSNALDNIIEEGSYFSSNTSQNPPSTDDGTVPRQMDSAISSLSEGHRHDITAATQINQIEDAFQLEDLLTVINESLAAGGDRRGISYTYHDGNQTVHSRTSKASSKASSKCSSRASSRCSSKASSRASSIGSSLASYPQVTSDECAGKEYEENRDFAREVGLRYSRSGDVMTQPPQMICYFPTESEVEHRQDSPAVPDEGKKKMRFKQKPYRPTTEEEVKLRLLAAKLSPEWRGEVVAPALARRIRDFQFAQDKRRKKFGDERPWGILGLYDHLASIRIDVEWAEEAAWRRDHDKAYLSWSKYEEGLGSGFYQPFFTYFLLLACTFMLLLSISLNGWTIEPLSVNPMVGPSADTLIKLGAKVSYLIVNEREVWRLATPMVLHAGLIHYVVNLFALWFVGSAVERVHGFFAAFIIFVIPAIGGTLLSAIFLPAFVSVGASGGIFGLIGACLADIVMNWDLLFSDLVNEGKKKHRHTIIVLILLLDITVNSLLGLTPFVDNFTHLGGMVLGFLCGLSTMERLPSDFFGVEKNCWSRAKHMFVRLFGVALSVASIAAATYFLFQGDGQSTPCSSCRYLSCVPMPPWRETTDKWWYCDDCSRATAQAKLNSKTGLFYELILSCPDGSESIVDLGDDSTSDESWLLQNLGTFCRQNCDTLFSQ